MGVILVLLAAALLYSGASLWLPHSLAVDFTPSLAGCLVTVFCLLLLYLALYLWLWRRAPHALDEEGIPAPPLSEDELRAQPQYYADLAELQRVLHRRYSFRWRRRLPWLLITGSAADVEVAVPGLMQEGWRQAGNVVLIWSGDIATGGNQPDLQALRRLRGRRPVDALILAGRHESSLSVATANQQQYGLWLMQQALKWQPPLYRLDIHALPWAKTEYAPLFSGALSATPFTPVSLDAALSGLPDALLPHGMAQVSGDMRHHFWLYLSSVLRQGGAERLSAFFAPFFAEHTALALHGVVLAGPEIPAEPWRANERAYAPSVVWSGVAEHCRKLRGRPSGVDSWRVVRGCGAAALALCAVGIVVSAAGNALLVNRTRELITQGPVTPSVSLLTQQQNEMADLERWQRAGIPWYRRFGRDITPRLQSALTPSWVSLSRREIIAPAQVALTRLLKTGDGRNEDNGNNVSGNPHDVITPRYNALKTYLMLANPSWVNDDASRTFLVQQLAALLPQIPVKDMMFFTSHLAAHPGLRITPDNDLVAASRHQLLEALSGPQAETQLYRQMLHDAALNYADVTLPSLTEGTDATGLFTLGRNVPGAFTREAYDGFIHARITALADARREQISRVLADPSHPADVALSPDGLQVRLTARWLGDYATAWQTALNSIRPVNTTAPLSSLDRLSDQSASPLVVLMQHLAWQGLVASPDEPHAKVNALLVPVFGGIVGMASDHAPVNPDGISLQTWLTQASRLRDRVRSLASFSGRTSALATSVLSGTQIDNTAAELPARVHAQLGQNLIPMADALFVAPAGQTWKGVMRGGMAQLDTQWRQDIADNWHQHFDGQYPFADSRTDSNLAELGDFIRPQSGRIADFIRQHLQGVLVYRDNCWQAADKLPPGLTVSPAFLAALNRLDRVGRTLFADGTGVQFRLQAGSARDVVQTELFVDGQRITYFNQMPFWQDMRWPDNLNSPGAMLTWTSVRAGARLYGDMPGRWGLIRLLEQAKATSVDNRHTRLTWTAPDGLSLNYRLEADPAHSPLTVLTLKGFQLPDAIFTTRR